MLGPGIKPSCEVDSIPREVPGSSGLALKLGPARACLQAIDSDLALKPVLTLTIACIPSCQILVQLFDLSPLDGRHACHALSHNIPQHMRGYPLVHCVESVYHNMLQLEANQ